MHKEVLNGVFPILVLGGLVFVAYGDQWAALPPPARRVSSQVRQSVTQLLVKTIPREAPQDDRYNRSWDVVETFEQSNQSNP